MQAGTEERATRKGGASEGGMGRRAGPRRRVGNTVSLLITNVGELVTNQPEPQTGGSAPGAGPQIGPEPEAGGPGLDRGAGGAEPAAGPRTAGPRTAGAGLEGPGPFAALAGAALVIDEGRGAWTGPAS